ncbi:MAG TPA: DNA-deoxyinosine glycosylase [Clostridiales bacterium]|nr:DNA-deoxyinosine glycosylase [Clostridiales bacterium]
MAVTVVHPYKPVFDSSSKVLILGTIASPKSRENGFYYTHPQNRFWRVVSDILSYPLPQNNSERIKLLLDNNIAIWDVLHSCTISGADDSSIKDPVCNDISYVLNQADIKAIFTTGKTAYKLYNKYCLKDTGFPAICLPSTSPANCRCTYDELKKEYQIILKYLK